MKTWIQTNKRLSSVIAVGVILALVVGLALYQQSHTTVGQAPKDAAVSIVLGENSQAPTMVVYTDILCDRCKEYHEQTLRKLVNEYVMKDKLQLDIRPIAIVSERSSNLTELALCANDQGAFMPAMDYLYEELYKDEDTSAELQASKFFKEHSFAEIAKKLSVDEKQLADCKTERRYDEQIAEADRQAGAAGVYSTPTTYIEGIEPIRGHSQYSYISTLIDTL